MSTFGSCLLLVDWHLLSLLYSFFLSLLIYSFIYLFLSSFLSSCCALLSLSVVFLLDLNKCLFLILSFASKFIWLHFKFHYFFPTLASFFVPLPALPFCQLQLLFPLTCLSLFNGPERQQLDARAIVPPPIRNMWTPEKLG